MVSLRIGMAMGASPAVEAETLLQSAETALLSAAVDDNSYAIFSAEQLARVSESMRLENDLEAAINNKEFEFHYQPKISAGDFKPCGAEALIRWRHPKRGLVSPDLFIPLADRTGRMEPLTAFVLNTTFRQAAEWPSEISLSINLSPRMLSSSELVELISLSLATWNFDPTRVFIEITEGALITDPESSYSLLSQLRKLGIQISIDDFGTGYSSLAYFKNIPADELKIDKSFVLNMFDDEGDKRIVRTILKLSKEFGLKVTAEGVEDERTALMLVQLGCDRLQGYHYSKPLAHPDFLAWLAEKH